MISLNFDNETPKSEMILSESYFRMLPKDIMKFLVEYYFDKPSKTTFAAFLSNKNKFDQEFASDCAKHGYLNLIKFAVNKGCGFDEHLVAASAAANGHVNVLQWLVDEDRFSSVNKDLFTSNRHRRMLLCNVAAVEGHLNVLNWLKEHDCEWSESVYYNLALGGHLEILKQLYAEKLLRGTLKIFLGAARGGHLEILEWIKDNGKDVDASICCVATGEEHLEVLKSICTQAAAGGHLEVLKWAVDNGCECDYRSCISHAIRIKHQEMLKWLGEMQQ